VPTPRLETGVDKCHEHVFSVSVTDDATTIDPFRISHVCSCAQRQIGRSDEWNLARRVILCPGQLFRRNEECVYTSGF